MDLRVYCKCMHLPELPYSQRTAYTSARITARLHHTTASNWIPWPAECPQNYTPDL